jgi:hypothetical protein
MPRCVTIAGDMVEYFMGHSLGATKDAYYRPDIAKLKEIYIKINLTTHSSETPNTSSV